MIQSPGEFGKQKITDLRNYHSKGKVSWSLEKLCSEDKKEIVTFWFGSRELRSRDLEKCVPVCSCLVAPSSLAVHSTYIWFRRGTSPSRESTYFQIQGFYPLQPHHPATCAYLSFVPLWRSRSIPLRLMNIKMWKIRAEPTSLCVTAPSTNKPGILSYSAGNAKKKKKSSS